MGLDFSHCEAHWSYGGFGRFRSRLAAEIGVNLASMEGFYRPPPSNERGSDLPIKWANVPHDVIVGLLNHSDCDGELSPDECKVIAPRLRELVGRWKDGDFDRQEGELLADGMDAAASSGEPLEFT